MVGSDADVIGPGGEGAEELAEEKAGEGEDGSDERARPAPAEVGELGDGLGEEDLDGVALEVAQDGGAEDGGDDDDAEEADADVVVDVGVGAVEEDLAVGVADGTPALAGDVEEVEGEPAEEVDVGRETFEAEFEFEDEELPEHLHGVISGAGASSSHGWRG